MKRVIVMGLGYIGLPTTLFFAKGGFEVVGVDVKEETVNKLKEGQITFEEPGLEELFNKVKNNIVFSTEPDYGDLFIITVPTPFLENRTIDERYIGQAFEDILPYVKKGNSIVLESTIPPMITEKYIDKIEKMGLKVGKDVFLGHVPETIIPGNMVKEFETNKRLIGGANDKSASEIAKYYERVVEGEIILTDLRTAEFVKVIENTYRDVNIALANELMRIADAMDIDIYEAIKIANKHPRVEIHSPGPGVGGHCISVDPWFLVGIFPEIANIVHLARDINDSQPKYIYDKLSRTIDIKGKTVGVYGLAYKKNIDDFRESPTFSFIDVLKDRGINYVTFDPWAKENVEEKQLFSFQEFLDASDIVVVYVSHSHLRDNMGKLKGKEVFEAMKIESEMETSKK